MLYERHEYSEYAIWILSVTIPAALNSLKDHVRLRVSGSRPKKHAVGLKQKTKTLNPEHLKPKAQDSSLARFHSHPLPTYWAPPGGSG